jgi:hypothetical protein
MTSRAQMGENSSDSSFNSRIETNSFGIMQDLDNSEVE